MALDVNALLKDMVSAASGSLKDHWPALKDTATITLKTIAHNLADIEKMKIAGTITEEKAALLIGMQKDVFKMLIATEEGLGLIAAQNALNAVIDVIRKVVNTTIGWTIL